MIDFKPSERSRYFPVVQMIPLVDILFINLSFFMAVFVFFRLEADLNISVPVAKQAIEAEAVSKEIIINIQQDGSLVLNQANLTYENLLAKLREMSRLNPMQTVIIRADEKTFHKDVVRVLDICASAHIGNISFATIKEK